MVPAELRQRSRRGLARARPGQPDRRAHRLQRRLRAAVRAGPGRGGRRRAGASDGVLELPRGRRRASAGPGRAIAAGRPGPGQRDRAGPPTRPGSPGRCARPGYPVRGASLAIDSDLPQGAGLSSSAALECAVALALTELAGLRRGHGRNWPPSPGGRRTSSSACRPGSWTSPPRCSARPGTRCCSTAAAGRPTPVPFDPAAAGLALLVIDTRARHALTDGGYGGPAHRMRARRPGRSACARCATSPTPARPGRARRPGAAPPGPARGHREPAGAGGGGPARAGASAGRDRRRC